MSLSARLTAYDHPGELAREPAVHDIRASILRAGRGSATLLRGLVPLAGRERSGEVDERAPLILGYRNSYPDAQNITSAWTGTATYLRRTRGTFGGTAYALQHERNLNATTASYTSTFTVARNTPFSVRLFIYKPNEAIGFPVVGFRFGQWQIQSTPKGLEIALRKDTWTQSIEDGMNDVRAAEGFDAALDDARYTYYSLFENLPSAQDFDGAQFCDITVIPESGGALNVLVGDELQRIFLPELIALRQQDQTIYDETALQFFGNGGAFAWQTGYPLFAETGDFTFPIRLYETPDDGINEFARYTKRAITDEPSGTSVDVTFEDQGSRGDLADGTASPQHRYDLKVTASTSNTRLTPFIYAAQVLAAGEPRLGFNGSLFYDSEAPEFKLAGGTISAIQEVSYSCEAENWSRQYRVIIADVDGQALPIANSYEACEFRHAGAWVNGEQQLGSNGFISQAERNGMTSVEYGQALQRSYARADSLAVLTVSDGWPLLDEHVILQDIILDGLTVGAAVRLLMRNAGWADSELTGISASYGYTLPTAAPGELPCVVARRGSRTGSELRELLDKWTLAAVLFHGFTGIWEIYTPSEEPVMTLHRDGDYNGRLRYYAPLDFTRDASNCYNDFIVEGLSPSGEPLYARWTIWSGFRRGFGVLRDPHFIGRRKAYDPIRDEGLRTQADVDWQLRCLVARYGRSARFTSCQAHWHRTLLPGKTLILSREVAGSLKPVAYYIARIGGGSAYDDRLSLVLQEKRALASEEIVIEEE